MAPLPHSSSVLIIAKAIRALLLQKQWCVDVQQAHTDIELSGIHGRSSRGPFTLSRFRTRATSLHNFNHPNFVLY